LTPAISVGTTSLQDSEPSSASTRVATALPSFSGMAAVKSEVQAGRLIAQHLTDPVISRELILAHAPHRAAADRLWRPCRCG
jgi:hypothetical protein